MSFPAYERYRDSGLDWGEVPAHWNVLPLKRVASFTTGWTPPTGRDDLYQGDLPWANIGDMDARILDNTAKSISELAVEQVGISPSPKGSLLFSFKLSVGQVAFAGRDMFTNEAIATFPPDQNFDLGFAYYALPLFVVANAATNIYGAKLLNQHLIQNAPVIVPPKAEQSAIAGFLDHETAKIDALVEEQRRLIGLLKEKRQAVISHAVTKGLDPTVPMKDSGAGWLGEVPAHWGLSRVKYVASDVVDCLHTTPTYDGELLYPAIRTADIERGRLLLDQARLVSREVYEERIQRLAPLEGDIIYSREGSVGLAALVPPGVNLCLGQRMMMLRIKPDFDPAFVMWVLNSDALYQQVLAGIAGATAPHVNISEVINFPVPVPPMKEQCRIAAHINLAISALVDLAAEADAAITLLQERRAALISAAVTGKIDVRGLVPAEAEAA